MLLDSRLEQWARLGPDAPALADADGTLTWRELQGAVTEVAARLRSQGLIPGQRVGVALRDGVDMVVALLAVMRAGLVVAPLDWRARPAERAAMMAGFGLGAIIVPGAARASGELGWPLPAGGGATANVTTRSADPVMILLSSGTTGAPSGALISAGALEARLQNGAAGLGDLAQHRYLSSIPLCFSMGVATALRMLAFGGFVQVHRPLYSPEELLATARTSRATLLCLVPATLRTLLKLGASDHRLLPELQLLVIGGAALSTEQRQATVDLLCANSFETYGAAAAGPISYAPFSDLLAHPGTVGRPHEWLDLRFVDGRGSPVPPGEPGLLQVRGPTVASALLTTGGTEAPFTDGWYQPGDIAALDADGYLRIEGRGTDVINRGGVNVYPELVEQALLAHPAVREVAVIGHGRADGDEAVIALLVLSAPASLAELEAQARVRLSPKYLPDQFVVMDQLPRTPAGKVRRGAARDLWLQR